MFDNLIEEYGQFAVMILVFIVGAAVYGGYLYYQRRQDIEKVNINLQQVPNGKLSQPPNSTSNQPPPLPKQLPDFVDADKFKGEQKGYIFKKGEKGQGYYKEN